jgi:excisionase family DNA binding protein
MSESPGDDRLLDVDEAAAYLNVSRAHLYAQTRRGADSAFPFVRLGRYVRFRKQDLVEWVEKHTVGGQNGQGA